jgi:hypothetical protein
MIICDYWSYLIRNNHRIIDILFDDYWIDYLPPIIPIIQRVKTKCEYLVHFWQRFWHMTSVIICDYLMIIWWLFDDYLMIINDYLHYCDYSLHWNVNVNDSPVFAFARLCCLTMPADRPARSVRIVSDLLVSSLQSAPHARPRWTHHTQLSPWGRAGDLGTCWKGERGIEYVIKCSRALVRSWARLWARARSNNALVYLRARASMSASVLHACEGRKELSWWT